MFTFDRIKQTAFAATAAIVFSVTMIGAAIGPVQVSGSAPTAAARA